MSDDLVVILTALNLEYEAVLARLVNPRFYRHKGTLFEVGALRGTRCRIALGLTGKGNNAAGILATRAIEQFSPVAVVFVGVAGALWDATPLGDVVVATRVYAYHGGTSEDDGLKARPQSWEVPHGVAQLAAHLARAGDWVHAPPASTRTPKVHFGPVAAGEIVHNSRISYEAKWIRQHYNDALAIEMEAAGVAQAGHLSGSPVAIVRGISDKADGTKTTSEDGTWQPRAAANAAAFAVRLARELITEREQIAMHEAYSARGRGSVHNVAFGQVGIQAAQVTGSPVWMGTAPATTATATDLIAELAAFGDHLRRAHGAGDLDDATYEEAGAEIDTARAALKADSPQDKKRSVLALKKVRGLVADVTDLATKVVALIAAVNGLT